MCIQHCGDNGFTSIKTCLLHWFVYTLVRNRPRKWIEDNTCPNAEAIFLILNENPTQCRDLADFVNPLPGCWNILIHSLTRVTPPPPSKTMISMSWMKHYLDSFRVDRLIHNYVYFSQSQCFSFKFRLF